MGYNPAEDLQRIAVPVLAINGSKDIQIDSSDLDRMANLINASFEPHLIPNMTHLLRIEEGDAAISKYKKELKKPLEPMVLEIVLQWMQRRIDLRSRSQM